MIGELRQVLIVREMRLGTLQALLRQRVAELAAVEAELVVVDGELAEIAGRRATWEQQWQHWLREDHVLQHGQDYNLSHVALSAWERDAQQARAEIARRYNMAVEQVRAARQAVAKAQVRIEALGGLINQARRQQRARYMAVVDSRAQDEIVSRAAVQRAAMADNVDERRS